MLLRKGTYRIRMRCTTHKICITFFFRLFRAIKRKTTYNGLRCDAKHVEAKIILSVSNIFVFGKEFRSNWKPVELYTKKNLLKNHLPVGNYLFLILFFFFFRCLNYTCNANWQIFTDEVTLKMVDRGFYNRKV